MQAASLKSSGSWFLDPLSRMYIRIMKNRFLSPFFFLARLLKNSFQGRLAEIGGKAALRLSTGFRAPH
jgi:hypothetical protein